MAESEEELKSFLKKETEKSDLKLSVQKKLRSWHLVPSLHGKKRGKSGNSGRFYFLGLQNHCRWWLQPWSQKMLAPWKKKAMTNLDNVLKSRDITLSTKVHIVKSMVFPVVMYGCKSWTIEKADAEELMLSNCGAGEYSWESLGLQEDQTSQS